MQVCGEGKQLENEESKKKSWKWGREREEEKGVPWPRRCEGHDRPGRARPRKTSWCRREECRRSRCRHRWPVLPSMRFPSYFWAFRGEILRGKETFFCCFFIAPLSLVFYPLRGARVFPSLFHRKSLKIEQYLDLSIGYLDFVIYINIYIFFLICFFKVYIKIIFYH